MLRTLYMDSLNKLTTVTRSNTMTLAGLTTSAATNVTANGSTATRCGCLLIRERNESNSHTFACTRGQDAQLPAGSGLENGLMSRTPVFRKPSSSRLTTVRW